jgi:hypothetical protein
MTQTVWVRPFAFAAAILFLLSWVFPVGADLAKDTSAFPKWWGTVDVAVALVLAIAVFWDSDAGSRKTGQTSRGWYLSHLSNYDARDNRRGRSGHAGWGSDHVGELRDRFLVANLAGLVYAALVACWATHSWRCSRLT